MSKLIVVCGATGGLGGSTARRMLKEGWKVRGTTRSKDSTTAKALSRAGVELAVANYDDVDALAKAFEGAQAVFAVTNGLEYLMELGQEGIFQREYQQMMNVAKAANGTSGLEHFIIHSLPAGSKLGGSDYWVAHMDAVDEIQRSMPELAKKSTWLWAGLFTNDFWHFPMMRPAELPGSYGAHVYIQPYDPKADMMIAGDTDHNIGAFVNAILRHPEISLPSKIAFVCTDVMPMKDVLAAWSEVTGRRATYVHCTLQDYEDIWGVFGKELGAQWAAIEKSPDWTKPYGEVLFAKDLKIPDSDLIGLRAALEKHKDKL